MLHNIKAALAEHRITQYEAAQRLGISDTRLSRIVRGRIEATTEEKRKLAQLLELPIQFLFSGPAPVPSQAEAQPAKSTRRGKGST